MRDCSTLREQVVEIYTESWEWGKNLEVREGPDRVVVSEEGVGLASLTKRKL